MTNDEARRITKSEARRPVCIPLRHFATGSSFVIRLLCLTIASDGNRTLPGSTNLASTDARHYTRNMCGIVGYVGRAQAAPILLDGLRRLEYRGYDSAGIAVVDRGIWKRVNVPDASERWQS